MKLTLYVPGLLLPAEVLDNTVFDLRAPVLSLWLGRSERRALPSDWLAQRFGLTQLPAAAARKVGAGGTAEGAWLCLDPVRWRVAAQGVTLDDPARLALTAEENAALLAAVAPLFADWGTLESSAPGCWELSLRQALALETQALPEAVGQPVDPRLPGGPDGPAWRRRLAEAQMLLHAHPANRVREAAGRPVVNSLWPWGAGRLPARPSCDYGEIWSGDPTLVGLCRLAGGVGHPPPARFALPGKALLAQIDGLAAPARELDALQWRAALLACTDDWLAPAMAALKRGARTSLELIGSRLGGTPETIAWTLRRGDLLRFWRKPRSLEALK